MRVRHWLGVLLFGAAVAVGAVLCARSTGHPAAAPRGEGAVRWYVDPAYVGPEDGSVAMPFNTITEAIDAAQTGDTIDLAAGTYNPGADITLPVAVTIEGKGRDATAVNAGFLVDAPNTGTPVTLTGLDCLSVDFDPDRADPAPIVVRDARLDNAITSHVPPHDVTISDSEITGAVGGAWAGTGGPANYLVERCTIGGGYGFSYGFGAAGGTFVLRDSTVTGGIGFSHGDVTGPTENTVERCTVTGDVNFPHGGGDIRNTVRDSTISGEISLRHSDITSNTIEGNRCQFIGDSSTFAFTIIRGNVVETAIADASGGPGGGIEDEIIEDNVVLDGFIASSGASVTIRRNVVTATTLTVLSDLANAGIFTNSGDPTNIVGNTVTIPSATPTTPLCDFDDPVVLRTSAGRGLVADNLFTGGACGIADSSGGDYIGNTIRGTHHGVITSGGYIWRDNVIVGNAGDGMITRGGPLEGNVIRDNAGAGVRLLYPVDTGGGAFASFGGNTIRGNGACDLVVDAGVDTAAVVFTRNNAWDHATEAEVRALDVRDERPGATPDLIVIAPLACFGRLDLVIEGTVTDQDAGDVVVCLRGRAEV